METIEAVFVPFCIEEQNVLGTDDGVEKFLQIFNDDEIKQELKLLFGQYNSSKDRWNVFVKHIRSKKTTVLIILVKFYQLFIKII